MKHLLASCFFFLLLGSISAQENESSYDSLRTYNVNLSDMMTTFGRKYMANGKEITKEQYEKYKEHWDISEKCRPCRLHTYNENGILQNVALQYTDCLVGSYKEYYPDGKLKVEGQFRSNTSSDWSNLRMRNLCSVKEGEWKYYETSGKLVLVEFYELGKLVNQEVPKETSEKPNGVQRLKGLFKTKDSYEGGN